MEKDDRVVRSEVQEGTSGAGDGECAPHSPLSEGGIYRACVRETQRADLLDLEGNPSLPRVSTSIQGLRGRERQDWKA
jgi:hypothetical protein